HLTPRSLPMPSRWGWRRPSWEASSPARSAAGGRPGCVPPTRWRDCDDIARSPAGAERATPLPLSLEVHGGVLVDMVLDPDAARAGNGDAAVAVGVRVERHGAVQ